ncbi:glycine zipper 2TM domain-containing protein [Steroidobacter sp.]|uniref:glycine zipper 2TM domain-containing protein n=1 Tax=Steroidobacter sp. TaxID=1978227 RepID=UPI001A36B73C|nr:glycine zipper 2TM domain-containing protein [Steroidobacter sp.]MBL8265916.1 glycine zipper 2TM domain-containing protein [Steroidobacter sp.]
MNKSLVMGLVLGAAVVTAGAAVANLDIFDRSPKFAEVLKVDAVKQTTRTPREVCNDHAVTHQAPAKDEKRIAGTVIGAVVGGVLGNQVGDGSGRKIATAAGAAAGGYAGNKVQQRMQNGNTYTTTETRCETVYDSKEHIVGYDVHYRLGDQEDTVRMDRDPGARIPVENGKLQTAALR